MNRIRNRIFVQFLFPLVFFYLLIIGGGLINMGNSYRESAIAQKSAAQQNIVRGIDDWLLSRVSEVVQLSRVPLLQSSDDQSVRSFLIEWQNTLSFNYEEIYLIEPQGIYWSTQNGIGFLEEPEIVNQFTQEGKLLLYGVPSRDAGDFLDKFVVAVPVKDKNNRIIHILTATISLETLQRVFSFFTYEEFDSWMVVNSFSTIITHKNTSFQGKNERFEYGTAFLEHQEWEDQQVFVRIMRNGWKMVAFLKSDKLIQAFRQSYIIIEIYSLVLFIILVVFILFLSSTVAKPIKTMTDRVQLIMNGDYKQQVHVRTKDELQELADAFNRLAKRMITLRTNDRFIYLGHISARMAHELRKPLNIIQLSSQSLGTDIVKNEKYKSLIDQEIINADKFIGQILNFAHHDSLNQVWYSLEKLLTAVVDKYKLLTDHHDIEITLHCQPDIPDLFLDIMKMEEVFSNLIQNAIEAIGESETNKRFIEVDLKETQEKEVHITFTDSGPGFNEELKDQFFDPYFTTRDKGTGLGLSLCYRVITAHNAYISLKNDADHHGVVKIVFPI